MAYRMKHLESGDIAVFPEPLDRVLVRDDYVTRHIGEDTPFTIPAGTIATVVGNWDECWDTHLIVDAHVAHLDDGIAVSIRAAEVWCVPEAFTILVPYVLDKRVVLVDDGDLLGVVDDDSVSDVSDTEEED